ncbi:MAG: hypothetical protein OXO52_09865 [Rhodospirillales bacterium]|nr:hypothetical protein [Rhodospirillales bacterium]MDE0378865.1 hypothetical protein [Rhodospirillales bacterium]
MTEALLPQGFENLAPFADWALEPEHARTAKKVESSMEQLRAFYDAMMPRLEEIIAYLDGVPGGDARPAPAQRLYLMSLSLVEVANLVEIYKRREVIEACDPLHFNPQR